MKQMLRQMAVHTNRRRFLGGASATVFATLAGLSTGQAAQAAAAPCSAPEGGGACSSGNCNGSRCTSGGGITCSRYRGCGGGYCWSHNGKKCCDCSCNVNAGGYHFYCYCYG